MKQARFSKLSVLLAAVVLLLSNVTTLPVRAELDTLEGIEQFPYVFHIDGDSSKFTSVSIDGTILPDINYTVQSGSTILTLKNTYMKTFPVGEHTVLFTYTDGDVSTNLTVKAADTVTPDTPSTEEPTNPKPLVPDPVNPTPANLEPANQAPAPSEDIALTKDTTTAPKTGDSIDFLPF